MGQSVGSCASGLEVASLAKPRSNPFGNVIREKELPGLPEVTDGKPAPDSSGEEDFQSCLETPEVAENPSGFSASSSSVNAAGVVALPNAEGSAGGVLKNEGADSFVGYKENNEDTI